MSNALDRLKEEVQTNVFSLADDLVAVLPAASYGSGYDMTINHQEVNNRVNAVLLAALAYAEEIAEGEPGDSNAHYAVKSIIRAYINHDKQTIGGGDETTKPR